MLPSRVAQIQSPVSRPSRQGCLIPWDSCWDLSSVIGQHYTATCLPARLQGPSCSQPARQVAGCKVRKEGRQQTEERRTSRRYNRNHCYVRNGRAMTSTCCNVRQGPSPDGFSRENRISPGEAEKGSREHAQGDGKLRYIHPGACTKALGPHPLRLADQDPFGHLIHVHASSAPLLP